MGGGGGSQGGGFFGGVAQGIEAARDFQLRRDQAKLEKDFNTARLKQMDTEQQLGQLQLQSLMRKIEAEGRFRSSLLGPPPPLEMGPSAASRMMEPLSLKSTYQPGMGAPAEPSPEFVGPPSREAESMPVGGTPSSTINGRPIPTAPSPLMMPSLQPTGGAVTGRAPIDLLPPEDRLSILTALDAGDTQTAMQLFLGALGRQRGETTKLSPGETIGKTTPEGGFTPTYTAPFKPETEKGPKPVSDENRIAMELYGKPYLELTPGQVAGTNAEMTTRRKEETAFRLTQQKEVQKEAAREIAVEIKRGQLQVELAETPLQEHAQFWLDRTGTRPPSHWTAKQAMDMGFQRVTPKDLEAITNANSALAQVEEYRELAPRLLVSIASKGIPSHSLFGMVGQFLNIQSNALRIGFLEQIGDPDARRLVGLFGAIATVARATGDTANIAVQERKFLQKFFIDKRDSLESATAKLDQAERILRTVVVNRNVPQLAPTRPEAAPRRGRNEPVPQRLSPEQTPRISQFDAAPSGYKKMLEVAYEEYLKGTVNDAELQGALSLVFGKEEAIRMLPQLQKKLLERSKAKYGQPVP